ncbi:hypothetical protein PENSPDRAFT_758178 [Peniophora sp. CONT]|nr:hypothetical protein PENSPDRAFT_758178 [Peniophora sp. CONT]
MPAGRPAPPPSPSPPRTSVPPAGAPESLHLGRRTVRQTARAQFVDEDADEEDAYHDQRAQAGTVSGDDDYEAPRARPATRTSSSVPREPTFTAVTHPFSARTPTAARNRLGALCGGRTHAVPPPPTGGPSPGSAPTSLVLPQATAPSSSASISYQQMSQVVGSRSAAPTMSPSSSSASTQVVPFAAANPSPFAPSVPATTLTQHRTKLSKKEKEREKNKRRGRQSQFITGQNSLLEGIYESVGRSAELWHSLQEPYNHIRVRRNKMKALYKSALESAGLDPDAPALELPSRLLQAWCMVETNLRNSLRVAVSDNIVESAYGLSVGDDLTPEQQAFNAARVHFLLGGDTDIDYAIAKVSPAEVDFPQAYFHCAYIDYADADNCNDDFQNPLIGTVFRKVWLAARKPIESLAWMFRKEFSPVPIVPIALALTAIRWRLARWRTGKYIADMKFDADQCVYFDAFLSDLKLFENETPWRRYCQAMFDTARIRAGIPEEATRAGTPASQGIRPNINEERVAQQMARLAARQFTPERTQAQLGTASSDTTMPTSQAYAFGTPTSFPLHNPSTGSGSSLSSLNVTPGSQVDDLSHRYPPSFTIPGSPSTNNRHLHPF